MEIKIAHVLLQVFDLAYFLLSLCPTYSWTGGGGGGIIYHVGAMYHNYRISIVQQYPTLFHFKIFIRPK